MMKKPTLALRPNILWSGIVFLAMLVVYTYVYYYEPLSEQFSPYWNDKVLDVLTLMPALAVAFLGIQITRQFEYHEPPFRIWLAFTIGWWWWLGGELSGLAYDLWYPDQYPAFTFIDVCWLLGYFFFGLALYYQFRLLYHQKQQSVLYLVYIGIGLAITYGLTLLAVRAGLGKDVSFSIGKIDLSWWVLYSAVLYPVCDLAEGGTALWLSFLFRRGTLGKAWWGLIAFAVADGINIFFWIGGDQWVSEQVYTYLDLFSSVMYVLGYMITALAFLAAYNLLRHGVPKRKTLPLEISQG